MRQRACCPGAYWRLSLAPQSMQLDTRATDVELAVISFSALEADTALNVAAMDAAIPLATSFDPPGQTFSGRGALEAVKR
jgi:hypothetical protein